MTGTLLNISGKIDPSTVELYDAVKKVANSLEIPFAVVGASARDIVMHHAFGAKVQRATLDVDFGIQLSDWEVFEEFKKILIEARFSETNIQHQLFSPSGMRVDIVPFGKIEDDEANISWPPSGEKVMNVLGFKEVCENAEIVRIREEPPLDIPVASIEGIVLLKIVAWADRAVKEMRQKDAKDICYLIKNYEDIPEVMKSMFEDEKLMVTYDWDGNLAGAHLLGKNAGEIASIKTREVIQNFLDEKIDGLNPDDLIEEMCNNPEREFERNKDLFAAFINGFAGKKIG